MEPNFSSYSRAEIKKFNSFFHRTQVNTIGKNARNLNELSRLFNHSLGMLSRINPIWNTWDGSRGDKTRATEARQWELNQLSDMKARLAQAIEHKKNYYQNHWLGKITRCFLKIFRMWDKGNTATVKNAEENLLATDTRNKLIKIEKVYRVCFFFYPLISTDWVRSNLNTDNFYNYNPNRRIKIKDNKYWNNGNIEIN
jgi:hypothetical protein